MARNRRSQSAASRFGPAVKATLLCLFIGGAGVGYVWQKDQIVRLGQEIKEREIKVTKWSRHNDDLRQQLAFYRSPQYVRKAVQDWNLGLVPAVPTQIWRLAEPPADWPRPETERQFAAGNPLAPPVK